MAQGYDGVTMSAAHGVGGPAGLPKEIANKMSAAVKKVVEGPEIQSKMAELTLEPKFEDTATYEKSWAESEKQVEEVFGKK